MAERLTCLRWDGDHAHLDRLVAAELLTQGDADAVRTHYAFLVDISAGMSRREACDKHYPESGQSDG